MQSQVKKVVFAEPPLINLLPHSPPLEFRPSLSVFKLASPKPSSAHPLRDLATSTPRVNLPNNSIRFISIKDYEGKATLSELDRLSPKKPAESLTKEESLALQINENVNVYKTEKSNLLQAEISSVLGVVKEKQEEITRLKGDLQALTVALKEKDILAKDAKQLAANLNSVLAENKRLNELAKSKIVEVERLREFMDRSERANEALRQKNEEVLEENARLQRVLEENFGYIDRNSKGFQRQVESLKKSNGELLMELQRQQWSSLNSQLPDGSSIAVLKQELEQYKAKVDRLMSENIRLNELNNDKASLDENLLQLMQKSEELIKENERLNILIREQTIENNSWRSKLFESDQKLLISIDQNNEKFRTLSLENEDLRQRNQKLLGEINQLVILIREKDKLSEENSLLRRFLEKKDAEINELRVQIPNKESSENEILDYKRKIENLLLENVKLNAFVEEKLKEYNALEDLSRKIEALIEENGKLNGLAFEAKNQIEYWRSRFFGLGGKS